MKGRKINNVLNLMGKHALYREDGIWYHHLNDFPGILFDKNGYIIFQTKSEYLKNVHLQHGQELHVKNGISQVVNYIPFSEEEKQKIKRILIK